MKKTTGLALAGVALIAGTGIVLTRQAASSATRVPAAATGTGVAKPRPPGNHGSGRSFDAKARVAGLPAPVESARAEGSQERQVWISERTEALADLAAFDDRESLHKILAELGNSDPVIRRAALSATRSFGSRDAIPWLEKIAAATDDPSEKKELVDAIEYLKLPTMLEHLEENPSLPDDPVEGNLPEGDQGISD